MKKVQRITWSPKLVNVRDVKPTPNNYKIKSDLGRQRLTQSLEMFGLASTVVVNTDMSLIDGNSRVEQAKERGEKKIWVSIPSRKLTPSEYKEMAAMYDFAKAGEVDEERIKGDLGKTKDFFDKWGITIPKEVMEKLSKQGKFIEDEIPAKGKNGKEGATINNKIDEMKVELFFTEKEEGLFRKLDSKLAAKFRTESVSQTVLMAYKQLCK